MKSQHQQLDLKLADSIKRQNMAAEMLKAADLEVMAIIQAKEEIKAKIASAESVQADFIARLRAFL